MILEIFSHSFAFTFEEPDMSMIVAGLTDSPEAFKICNTIQEFLWANSSAEKWENQCLQDYYVILPWLQSWGHKRYKHLQPKWSMVSRAPCHANDLGCVHWLRSAGDLRQRHLWKRWRPTPHQPEHDETFCTLISSSLSSDSNSKSKVTIPLAFESKYISVDYGKRLTFWFIDWVRSRRKRTLEVFEVTNENEGGGAEMIDRADDEGAVLDVPIFVFLFSFWKSECILRTSQTLFPSQRKLCLVGVVRSWVCSSQSSTPYFINA